MNDYAKMGSLEEEKKEELMNDYEQLVKKKLEAEPKAPPPRKLKMQMGMPINFHGYAYKVIKIMKRGRIVLKLMGEIPDEPNR